MKNRGLLLLFFTMFFVHAGFRVRAQKIDLGKMLTEAVGETGVDEKKRLDSVDFQFAMSVYENTGFLDADQKGDFTANVMYLFREESQKTTSDHARDTLNMAVNYYKTRFYRLSEMTYQQARRMMERDGLTAEINYVRCLSGLGLIALIQGKSGEAESLLQQSMALVESKLGKNSPAYAANLNNRAKLDQLLGRFNEAERGFQQAAMVTEKKYGAQSIQMATVLNNQAMLQLAMGRKEDAVTLMEKASSVAAAEFGSGLKGKKSFENRMFLSNLALVYQVTGKFTEAGKTFTDIRTIYEKRKQTNNPEYANVLNQLALLNMQTGQESLAEPLLNTAAEIYRKKFTEQSPAFARVLHDQSILYRNTGRLPQAEAAGEKALTIRRQVLGETHPDYARSLEQLGLTRWQAGNIEGAYQNLKGSTALSLKFIREYFKPMSEAEQTRYWETLQPGFQRFYAFVLQQANNHPEWLKDVFDYQLATKALLLQSTSKTRQAILSSGNKQLISEYNRWLGIKEQLSRFYSLSKEELQQQKVDLKAMEAESNRLEKSLSDQSAAFSEGYQTNVTRYEDVVASLNDQEAVLEVTRVRGFAKDFTDEVRYLMMVARRGLSSPVVVVLQNGKQLETRYARYYKNMIAQRQPDVFSYPQFWSKADSLLGAVRTVYFSPDGVYNQINVNTLRKPEGDYVLNRYELVIIGNPREVMTLKSAGAKPAAKSAFLMGFPEYGGVAPALPGTKVELEGVAKVLKTAGYPVTLRQQMEATETQLKAVRSPSVLHVATHGYFLADVDVAGGALLGVRAENAKSNPLLRAGLILANPAGNKRDTTRLSFDLSDDGVLTAYEAMNLDLTGTGLVVLSACETGLGEVRAGEGVYGLQRSFLVAGAQALVMSLWKVDDAATQELMNTFYALMSSAPNRLQAFRSAQKKLMAKYPDPYYWGAFVMMGR